MNNETETSVKYINSWFPGSYSTTVFKAFDSSGSKLSGVTCQMSIIPRIVECCGLTFDESSRNDVLTLQVMYQGTIWNSYYNNSSYDGIFSYGFDINEIISNINSSNILGLTLSLYGNTSYTDNNFSWTGYDSSGNILTDLMGICTYICMESSYGYYMARFSRMYNTSGNVGSWSLSRIPNGGIFEGQFLVRVTC